MNILYTCDNNFVWLMGISTISLFENNKHIKEINVYLLGEDISDENKFLLYNIANKYNRELVILDVPKINIPPLLVSSRWPLSAFTRLFSGQLLPQNIKDVIYLDCDTIISGDISNLEKKEFDNNVVLGVKDCISGFYKKNIGLNKNAPYINAGVLLINLEKLRQIDIREKIQDFLKKYIKLICFADQDVLNGILKGRIGVLEPQYNVMTVTVTHSYENIIKLRRPTNYYSKNELHDAFFSPLIIHYTTNMLVNRPWFNNSDHPKKDDFIKYKNISYWKNRKLEKKVFLSKESLIISFFNKCPEFVSLPILGLIHSVLKPIYFRIRSMFIKKQIS